MPVDIQYLTSEGAASMRKELEEMKGPMRYKLSQRLRAAIQMGDLSENADYHAAKEEQGFLEGRIQELEYILNNLQIIDDLPQDKTIINIGSRVTVQEDDFDPETYFLVGPKEADPKNGRISHLSPIGSALMGHRVGEAVPVETPGGKINFKILKIE
jgi:transcription elongation factor GreA